MSSPKPEQLYKVSGHAVKIYNLFKKKKKVGIRIRILLKNSSGSDVNHAYKLQMSFLWLRS